MATPYKHITVKASDSKELDTLIENSINPISGMYDVTHIEYHVNHYYIAFITLTRKN